MPSRPARRPRPSQGASFDRAAEVDVEVAGRRPVHPRDLHVAPERDRADAVLDSAALPLRERGREEDVELPRPHLDRERGEEVPGLVDEDQEGEAPDGDCDVHGCGLVNQFPRARRRNAPGLGVHRGQLGEVRRRHAVDRASVRSTTPAMPRKGSSPSRKAATATSLAALSDARRRVPRLAGRARQRAGRGTRPGPARGTRGSGRRRGRAARSASPPARGRSARTRSGRACPGSRGVRARRRLGSARARARRTSGG